MALPQALPLCPPVRRLVFRTPVALASTGVLQLRLVNVAGFMDLGAAPSHDEFLRACNITSCTEAATDCAVNTNAICQLHCMFIHHCNSAYIAAYIYAIMFHAD